MACVAPLALFAPSALAEETLTDSTTGKRFPCSIAFVHQDIEQQLSITGVTARRKFFLNIYSIAHYMQDPPRGNVREVTRAVLRDGPPKQITMDFVRDVSADRIQEAFREGFQGNASPSELEDIRPLLRQFLASIYKDVQEDDTVIIRWLPGGVTVSLFQGEEVNRITSVTFARLLWSLWFGERPVVDRAELIRLLTVDP